MMQRVHPGLPMRHIRNIHFVGIGGAGMNGIAEVLCSLGYTVSGSDLHENAQIRRLRQLGVRVHLGHDARQVEGVDVVVTSSAIPADNPELQAASQARIPMVPRAAMLGELLRFSFGIAVAGTHGKTTTASLITHLLAYAGLGPSSIIGGQLRHDDEYAALGEGEYLVCEADESDASFLHLNPLIAVVTNIDDDHLVNYDNDMQRLREAYRNFLQNLPFYGLAVLCADDPEVQAISRDLGRQVVTYATDNPQADIVATDIDTSPSGCSFRLRIDGEPLDLPVHMALPGTHNVRNALAAVAVARDRQIDLELIVKGLASFRGISRRFEMHGALPGLEDVLWIDDYGHHPTEISETLKTVAQTCPERRQILAFQPHRYTRTRDLHQAFVEALKGTDKVLLLDVYPAGEAPIPGADSDSLAQELRKAGVDVIRAKDDVQMYEALHQLLQPHDVLLTMGAGSIGHWAQGLWQQLEQREESLV